MAHLKNDEKTDRRIRRTRKALRTSLEKALVKRQLDQITIRDIAEDADIAYTTFFRHYPSKESLLSDLADREIEELLDLSLPMFSAENSFAATLKVCERVKENEQIWSALLNGGAAANIRATFIQKVEERSQEWPDVSDWLPPDVGTPILCGIALEVLGWWLGKAPHETPENVAKILNKFFSLVSDK